MARTISSGNQLHAERGAFAFTKKTPDVAYRPIEELAHQMQSARVFLPEGMKSPDIMLQIPADHGFVWWMGDQFSNSGVSDQIWPLRVFARFVGSGLGYRCNSKPELVYVQDPAAWLRSIRAELQERPPTIVVPAHGDALTEDAAGRTGRAIDAIDPRVTKREK